MVGNGTFNPAYVQLPSGVGIRAGCMAWGDFNNDGNMDLAVTGYNGGDSGILRVYLGNGNGTFNPNYIEPVPEWGRYWSAVAWGDYNNDGNLETPR